MRLLRSSGLFGMRLCLLAMLCVGLVSCGTGGASSAPAPPALKQQVSISGNQLLRDGVPWVPHGVQLVAFVAAPKVRSNADEAVFAAAYAHYSTAELDAIKAWGADTIRFQLSQPGADPNNAEGLYDPNLVSELVGAVKYTRSIGLNAIVSIQDEMQSGESAPASLPNPTTNAVWYNLAPMLKGDNGIILEMMNEPEPLANTADWQTWETAMNGVIQTIRGRGANNPLLADGLNYALTLDGVVPLTDPLNQVFYSSHPYYHSAADETPAVWATRFGNAAATYPVIVGEWTTANTYYHDACTATVTNCTATAALAMLQYMQGKNIGLIAVTYDFGLPMYGGIVSDYNGTPTSFAGGLNPGDAGFGPGTVVQQWYKTGTVPGKLE